MKIEILQDKFSKAYKNYKTFFGIGIAFGINNEILNFGFGCEKSWNWHIHDFYSENWIVMKPMKCYRIDLKSQVVQVAPSWLQWGMVRVKNNYLGFLPPPILLEDLGWHDSLMKVLAFSSCLSDWLCSCKFKFLFLEFDLCCWAFQPSPSRLLASILFNRTNGCLNVSQRLCVVLVLFFASAGMLRVLLWKRDKKSSFYHRFTAQYEQYMWCRVNKQHTLLITKQVYTLIVYTYYLGITKNVCFWVCLTTIATSTVRNCVIHI